MPGRPTRFAQLAEHLFRAVRRGCIEVEHASGRVARYGDGTATRKRDSLAVEEPMEMRLSWVADGERRVQPLAVTMRTPGNDFELTAGFLRATAGFFLRLVLLLEQAGVVLKGQFLLALFQMAFGQHIR